MLTIGVDAHKHVHVAVVVDPAGREVARWRGANRPAGWRTIGHSRPPGPAWPPVTPRASSIGRRQVAACSRSSCSRTMA